MGRGEECRGLEGNRRRGHHWPKTSKQLYAANKKLDKDRDGVICAVRRRPPRRPLQPRLAIRSSSNRPAFQRSMWKPLRGAIGAGRMSEQQFRYLWTILYTFANNTAHYCPDYAVPENKASLLATNTTAAKLGAFGLDGSYQGWAAESLARYLQMTCAAKGFTVA